MLKYLYDHSDHMVIFWVLVVAGALWLISRLAPHSASYAGPVNSTPAAPSETPLDVLKRRYASGELTKAEYEQMRQDLLAGQR